MYLQLAAMRAAGIESLRFFVWHDHDGAAFETIPSAGGRLVEPYRGNFIAYLHDARALGFKSLEVVFGPVLGNDPQAIYGGVPYDPALFDENWSLIRDVRALAEQYGPTSRFDLLNEGAPSDAQALKAQVIDYIARLYGNYVDAYGNRDVTVSIPSGDPTRLMNLLIALRESGRPLPTYFEIHPAYDPTAALRDLESIDAGLIAAGLDQPLIIGEGPYNDPEWAAAVHGFITRWTRPVTEVLEWPLQRNSTCDAFSVAPPYRANSYIQEFQGPQAVAVTTTLHASLPPTGRTSLQTAWGLLATALEDGTYSLDIFDRSTRAGFVLTGPGIRITTGGPFRGNRAWTLTLPPGVYTYGRGPKPNRRFTVLHGP
jgi:hypothetical protein